MFAEIYKETYRKIHDKAFEFSVINLSPSEWTEKNIYLTSAESKYTGFLSYDLTPYFREIVDSFDRDNPMIQGAIMKCAQIGGTTSVLVPLICHTISEDPCNMMFISGNETLVKDTIRDRLDPVIRNSKLDKFVRSSVKKKKNQKSGDTDAKKEFAGGSLTSMAYNPRRLRFYSVKKIFADEFDDAPRSDKKEGSIRSLLENRTTSFGNSKKIMYNSTPTIKGASNIEEVFLEGDQRKWHWNCPHCKEFIPIEWSITRENGTFAGIKWKLNESNEIIRESIYYECQNCGGKIYEKDKYSHNLKGQWFPTAKPKTPYHRSWWLNAIVLPIGFDDWFALISSWLKACPPNEPVSSEDLKVFLNTKMGLLWEDKGKALSVNELMNNTRAYRIGTVPDVTCENDENGKIVMICLICDLGGVEKNNEKEILEDDVRLDWEIVAYSSKGQNYSIDHGSIGTFQRTRSKNKNTDENRIKYNYNLGEKNNVWDLLDQIRTKELTSESGENWQITMTLVDTGNFTIKAFRYINKWQDYEVKEKRDKFVIGVKGHADEYRRNGLDKPIVKRSNENKERLYILNVDDLKDILSTNMQLKIGVDGYQPSGYINYPIPENNKYTMRTYFGHLESEKRIPVEKDGVEIGYKWRKKHSSVENHFFDINVYAQAAKIIFIDRLRQIGGAAYSKITWDDYCEAIS